MNIELMLPLVIIIIFFGMIFFTYEYSEGKLEPFDILFIGVYAVLIIAAMFRIIVVSFQ